MNLIVNILRRRFVLLSGGILLGLMPLGEQPHLAQKWNLLVSGWLKKPEDWFDLLLHGGPLAMAIILIGRDLFRHFSGSTGEKMDIRTMIQQGAKIVDVRTPGEVATGSYPGAMNIPLQQLPDRFAEIGDKNNAIVVFCQSGGRSESAKNFLMAQGYTNVVNAGGLHDMPR